MRWPAPSLLLLVVLSGCPGAPSTGGTPAVEPGPAPPRPAPPPSPATSSAPDEEAPDEAFEDPPRPDPARPATPPPPDAPPAEEVLRRAQVLALGPEVRIGFEGAETLPTAKGPQPVARLTVSSGPAFYLCDLAPGDPLRVGDAVDLEALAVTDDEVRLRWVRARPGPAADPTRDAPARARLVLRTMALYRFPDGTRLGVGNVSTLIKPSGDPVQVVTLTLFPPAFTGEPGQVHDTFPRLIAGRRVEGRAGLALEVLRMAPNKIELRLGR